MFNRLEFHEAATITLGILHHTYIDLLVANFFDNSERKDLAHVTIMDTPEACLRICNE